MLVALLLNHAVLGEGEALFVAAGVPHCYLHGFGAEVMAASDNVLRAGLTSKRVNVPELLQVLDFRPAPLRVRHAEPDGAEEAYPVPVPDFRLARLRLGTGPVALPASGPQIVLCIAGTARLRAPAARSWSCDGASPRTCGRLRGRDRRRAGHRAACRRGQLAAARPATRRPPAGLALARPSGSAALHVYFCR